MKIISEVLVGLFKELAHLFEFRKILKAGFNKIETTCYV